MKSSRLAPLSALTAAWLLGVATLTAADNPPAAAAPRPRSYAQLSATTEQVATAYVGHYFARNFDEMEKLCADEVTMRDPTAETLFGVKSIPTNRAETFAQLRETFAGLTHFAFRPTRQFFSGEHAVFEGETDWTMRPLGAAQENQFKGMPLVVIVRVKEGRVVEHRDFGDYRVFVQQFRAQQAAAQQAAAKKS